MKKMIIVLLSLSGAAVSGVGFAGLINGNVNVEIINKTSQMVVPYTEPGQGNYTPCASMPTKLPILPETGSSVGFVMNMVDTSAPTCGFSYYYPNRGGTGVNVFIGYPDGNFQVRQANGSEFQNLEITCNGAPLSPAADGSYNTCPITSTLVITFLDPKSS